jgi:transcriptional regulator with XRE-family HTH domain
MELPKPSTAYVQEWRGRRCRAARGLLKWSQRQLADMSGVGLLSTVVDFANDKRDPRSDNLTAIRHALEEAGVEFIPAKNGKGVGVRLNQRLV